MKLKLTIYLIVVLYTQVVYSQVNVTQTKYDVHETFSKSIYLEDLSQLVDSIKLYHPQPFEFITEENFDLFVETKKNSISDSTTISEFVWLCKSLMAIVGCGHTSISVENVLALNPSMFFPMEVFYIDDKLYVTDPLSNKKIINLGDEIISINGIDVKKLKSEIYATINSDGYNPSLRELQTNENFRAYCAFQLKFPPTFTVEIKTNTDIKTLELEASKEKSAKINYLSQCKDNLCFEEDLSNSLGIITIRSFNFYNDKLPEFKMFIDSCFKQIELNKLENLVIDVRNNYGGDPFCASYLLQYIAVEPFRYYKKNSTKWYSDLEQMTPLKKNNFSGALYVLINGGCFSTTGHFVSLLKAKTSTIFIGQETGATYSCNANSITFQLKNTGIYTSVATEIYQTDVTSFLKSKGILPHYTIYPKLYDIINNLDLEMEKVINLINER